MRSAEGSPYSAGVTVYRERLAAPWWLWLGAAVAAAFVATQLAVGAPALRHPLTYGVAVALALAGVWSLSRITISVDPDTLRVDDARLPRAVIGEVTVIDAAARRELLGPEADPLAFVITRPWLAGGVLVELGDPDDPTPYWFIGTRHPERLAATLRTTDTPRTTDPLRTDALRPS